MGSEPLIEVGGDADVALIWNSETLDEIDVLHEAVPLRTMAGASAFADRSWLRPTKVGGQKLACQPKL